MVSEIRNHLLGVVFFTLMIVAGLAFVAEMKKADSEYSTYWGIAQPDSSSFDTDNFSTTFNRYNDVVSSVSDLQDSVSSNSSGFFGYTGGAIEALFGGAYNTLGLIFTSFSFVTSTDENNPGILYGLTTYYHIPSWFPILLIAIIIIVISFAILKAVFQVS